MYTTLLTEEMKNGQSTKILHATFSKTTEQNRKTVKNSHYTHNETLNVTSTNSTKTRTLTHLIKLLLFAAQFAEVSEHFSRFQSLLTI